MKTIKLFDSKLNKIFEKIKFNKNDLNKSFF